MADGDYVRTEEVSVTVYVREWDQDEDGIMYDWITSSGLESDELYESAEDALRDGRSRLT